VAHILEGLGQLHSKVWGVWGIKGLALDPFLSGQAEDQAAKDGYSPGFARI